MPSPFVQIVRRELRKRRVAEPRLSDGKYAEWLGCSPTLFSLTIISEQRPPARKIIVCAFSRYPHNHAPDAPPPPPEPLPQEWLDDGLEPGCGCVACDFADAVGQGFGSPLLAVPPSGPSFRPFLSRRLLQLAEAQAGTERTPQPAAAN